MRLLTKEIERKLPALYATEDLPEEQKMAVVKYFHACSSATWYVFEGEKQEDGDWLLFCFVSGLGCDELGYVSLNELRSFRGRFGLGIERDLHFRPTPLSELRRGRER